MGLTPIPGKYLKKKPLDIDMSKLSMPLTPSAPLAGQGASMNPSGSAIRIGAMGPAQQRTPSEQASAPLDMSSLATPYAPNPAITRAAQESAANVRDVGAKWAPSASGGLADLDPSSSLKVPGLGGRQSLYYSAPGVKQGPGGAPDQSLNTGYEERRRTWYPSLTSQQLARAPWLNAGNDAAFKRALSAGFTADELTDATPWEAGQRFTPSGQKISLGQARLEGDVPRGYVAPASSGASGASGGSDPYAGLKSALEGSNPYGDAYKQAYISAGQGELRSAYAQALEQARRDAAARGLSASGMSGYEQDAQIRAAMAQAEGNARLQREAALGLTDKQADYGLRQGAGLDAFNLAKAGGTQGAFQFTLAHALQQALGFGGLDLQRRGVDLQERQQNALLPGQAEALSVGNAATRAQTQRIQQMTPVELQEALARVAGVQSENRVRTATEQDAITRSGQQVQAGNIANESAQVALATGRQLSPLQVGQARATLDAANKQGILTAQQVALGEYALAHKDELIAQGKWAQWAPLIGSILAAAVGNKGITDAIGNAATQGIGDLTIGALP